MPRLPKSLVTCALQAELVMEELWQADVIIVIKESTFVIRQNK